MQKNLLNIVVNDKKDPYQQSYIADKSSNKLFFIFPGFR